MKSVTIKDRNGDLLIRVTHGKRGYKAVAASELDGAITIEARDDRNCKVVMIPDRW